MFFSAWVYLLQAQILRILHFADVVGEDLMGKPQEICDGEKLLSFVGLLSCTVQDPRSNPKLKTVLEKMEKKIGWKKIKEAVKDLITVCGTNYQRELDGQAPLPVFLNRLFLGNPGTGPPIFDQFQ